MNKALLKYDGDSKVDGWTYDYDSIEHIKERVEERTGLILSMEEVEDVLLTLVAMGYIQVDEENS